MPSWKIAWKTALAVGMSERRTRLGSTVFSAESSKVPRPPASAVQTNSGQSAGRPPAALRASPALTAAITIDTPTSRRLRSAASTSEPPKNDPASSGPSAASETRPTSSEEPVSL
jgi:hypothetical protein